MKIEIYGGPEDGRMIHTKIPPPPEIYLPELTPPPLEINPSMEPKPSMRINVYAYAFKRRLDGTPIYELRKAVP